MQTKTTAVSQRATAQVTTDKAERYLKALCNHFDRKASAAYETSKEGITSGQIRFDFGDCTMVAEAKQLNLNLSAGDTELLDRLKHVIASHLLRFAAAEELQIDWQEA